MADFHALDVLIDEAGHEPTAMNTAIVAALANGVAFEAIYPVLAPLARMSVALQKIQAWSTAAQKPEGAVFNGLPVTQNPDGTLTWNGQRYASEVDLVAGKPIPAPVAEKLPRLTDPQLSRLLHVTKTAQYDQGLADELGANYNAYVNAYSVGGYYYDPRV